MKIALVGYGKMGRSSSSLRPNTAAKSRSSSTSSTTPDGEGITAENFRGVDVAIEFSTPEAVVDNIERLAALGVNTVVGTTGWAEHLDHVRSASRGQRHRPGLEPELLDRRECVLPPRRRSRSGCSSEQPEYGAWAWEIHHDTKKDAPSGTLLKLVEEMKKAGYTRNDRCQFEPRRRHPGTHEIGFDSAADTITLRHAARSREGFARGALKAAHGFTASAVCTSSARRCSLEEHEHVYRMRHGAGHAVQTATDRWTKRRSASSVDGRSTAASTSWSPAAPPAKARR